MNLRKNLFLGFHSAEKKLYIYVDVCDFYRGIGVFGYPNGSVRRIELRVLSKYLPVGEKDEQTTIVSLNRDISIRHRHRLRSANAYRPKR
jgi:hypothetical protein